MRRYRKEFFKNKFQFRGSRQGKHERLMVLSDEELRKNACKRVHENAFKNDQPNMMDAMFCNCVNSTLLPSQHLPPHFPRTISLRTAVCRDLNLCRTKGNIHRWA